MPFERAMSLSDTLADAWQKADGQHIEDLPAVNRSLGHPLTVPRN